MRNFFNNLFFYLLFLGIGANVLTSLQGRGREYI